MTKLAFTLVAMMLALSTPLALGQFEETGEQEGGGAVAGERDSGASQTPQDTRDQFAVQVLEESAAALLEHGALVADFVMSQGDGQFSSSFNTAKGKLLMLVDGEDHRGKPIWRVRITGAGAIPIDPIKAKQENDAVGFDVVWDNDWIKSIDHFDLVYQEDAKGAGSGWSLADNVRPQTLTRGTPYEMELRDRDLQYEGTTMVGDVECDIVSAKMLNPNNWTYRWYIGRDDRLPHRYDKVLGAMGAMNIELKNVRADRGALAGETWEIDVPAAYERKIAERKTRAPVANGGTIGNGEGARPAAARVQLSPPWALKDGAGEQVTTESLRGKVAVLYFWGTWCIPCRRAAPDNISLFEDYSARDDFVMLGMAVRERDAEAPVSFAKDKGYDWRQLVEADQVAELYGVSFYPTWIVLGKGGEILHHSGIPEGGDFTPVFAELRAAIDGALEPQGAAGAADRTGEQSGGGS